MGGVLAGMPVVAGPLLLVMALEQGTAFTGQAAAGTLWGLFALCFYIVAYVRVAERRPWPVALVAAYAAFGLATWGLKSAENAGFPLSWQGGLAAALVAVHVSPRLMPKLPEPPPPSLPTRWDLPLRAGSAALLVMTLTGLAAWLGPGLSGLLTSFPVVTTVLAVFTHLEAGPGATERIMKALLWGLHGYAVFLAVLAAFLERLGMGAAFGLGLVSATAVQALVYLWISRRQHQ